MDLTTDTYIALASALIALCSVALTLWMGFSTNRHNRLSVKPYLRPEQHWDWSEAGWLLRFDVANTGIGPAVIASAKGFRAGQIEVTSSGENLPVVMLTAQVGRKIKYEVLKDWWPLPGDCIPAGESRTLIQVSFPGSKHEEGDVIRKYVAGLEIMMEYESFYGKEFTMEARVRERA